MDFFIERKYPLIYLSENGQTEWKLVNTLHRVGPVALNRKGITIFKMQNGYANVATEMLRNAIDLRTQRILGMHMTTEEEIKKNNRDNVLLFFMRGVFQILEDHCISMVHCSTSVVSPVVMVFVLML